MRSAILAEASLRTMMASFKSSHLSVISGIRCFAAWADEHRPGTPHLPASNDDLRLWSSYFQNGGAFSNYVTNLKTAHTLRNMQVDWDEELLRRLRSGSKRLNVRMIKAALKYPVKKEMVALATKDGFVEDSAIWSLAYDRLFRVENELLPLETRQVVPSEPLTSHGTHASSGNSMPRLSQKANSQ